MSGCRDFASCCGAGPLTFYREEHSTIMHGGRPKDRQTVITYRRSRRKEERKEERKEANKFNGFVGIVGLFSVFRGNMPSHSRRAVRPSCDYFGLALVNSKKIRTQNRLGIDSLYFIIVAF